MKNGVPTGAPLAVVLVAAVFAACGGDARGLSARTEAKAPVRHGEGGRREVASNVLFEDYAGTKACAACHATYVASWLASPMHNMTRAAKNAQTKGPFDGATFAFKSDRATLTSAGGDRFMTLTGAGAYRVTKIIGGHHREDYVGIPVAAARAGAPATGEEEVVLPVSFVYASSSLRYKGYSVMVKERPALKPGPVWKQTCIFCHNTPPYLSTVLGALAGGAAKPYQGQVVDPLLPEDKRATYAVTDPAAMRDALSREMARLGARTAEATPLGAVAATRARFGEEHLVEVGIGCEACHLGSAAHVKDPTVFPTFEPRSAFFEVRLPSASRGGVKERTARTNRACARCHQVLFSGYEHTWEGGERRRSAGGSNINSGEARDMMLGACSSELSCAGCHDPHARDATSKLRALDAAGKDALCTRCHTAYAAPEAARAHSHHDPAREGARCASCHMPAKTMGLDGDLTAYHRIGSPTAMEKVLLDRPLECALCHADKSVSSLLTTMETWWNKRYDRPSLEKLYGDLGANVLLATAERGKPHEQGVAYAALGRAGASAPPGTVPALAAGLRHPYPLVRGYAKRGLETLSGRPVPIDLDADAAALDAEIAAWLASRPSPR